MPATTPTPSPLPEKPKAVRGIVNQKQVDSLDKAGFIAAAAQKTDYAPPLAEREINKKFVNDLDTDIEECSKRIGKAGHLTTEIRLAAEAEGAAQDDLLAAFKEVQTTAIRREFQLPTDRRFNA